MALNPRNVVKLLEEEFASENLSVIIQPERDLAQHLSAIIRSRAVSNIQVEEEEELVFENSLFAEMEISDECEALADFCLEEEEESSSSEEFTQASSSNSWQLSPVPVVTHKRDDVPFSKRKRAVDCWKGSSKTRRKLSSVQSKFRFVTSITQLELWQAQIQRNGPRHEKIRKIALAVRNRFIDATRNKTAIHDEDLRRWALQESRKESFTFKASKGWLQRFKLSNRITSRKITKFVSKKAVEQSDSISKWATAFVQSIRKETENYTLDEICNTDQSGFNLEIHSGRTLAEVGDKKVDAAVQSVAATTHSYTIMPTITASGKLLSPLVVVTKEPNGKFGPVVEHTMFKSQHILPVAAKSSMMGKEEIPNWFEKAFLPNTGEKSLLLVDSLNAYSAAKDALSKDKNILIKTIPPHTTGEAQPLDVYFFRPWKKFCRKVYDFVLLENLDFCLRNRNNIYKLQLVTHNQFCAPRFQSFRQYAWYKAGYLEGTAPTFINPVDYCFQSEDLVCSCPDCDHVKLLKCAWSEKPFCINNLLVNIHLHDC